MIDKINIPIHNKNAKKIKLVLSLDGFKFWWFCEFDDNDNEIYFINSNGWWAKTEYDSDGNEIYYKNSDGLIKDNNNNEI